MLRQGVNSWLTIIVLAALFLFMHMLSFYSMSITQQTFILVATFSMDVIAGYLHRQIGSLLLAIVTHTGFNLGELYGSCHPYRSYHLH